MTQSSEGGTSLNIPNLLTLFRISLIPVLVLVFYLPYDWNHFWAAAIFFVAAVTDWFDGYLARKLGQMTKLGAFLDPVADKLIVAAALVMLVERHASAWLVVPAIVIIGREITISALREWMAEIGKRTTVAVSYIGKLKATAQMAAIVALLASPLDFATPMIWLGYSLLYVATALTLWSMVIYLRAAWPELNSGR